MLDIRYNIHIPLLLSVSIYCVPVQAGERGLAGAGEPRVHVLEQQDELPPPRAGDRAGGARGPGVRAGVHRRRGPEGRPHQPGAAPATLLLHPRHPRPQHRQPGPQEVSLQTLRLFYRYCVQSRLSPADSCPIQFMYQ